MDIRFGLKRCAMLAVFVMAMAVAGFTGTTQAFAYKYSTIVIDARTGQVLSAYRPDVRSYPASLTKMMTLYLTFQALQQKRITLDTRFRVSAHAASMQPTKLDLVPGQTVPVRDLILGIVTESANDAAVVLAEGLGGSEPAFAALMTRTAHSFGMDNTNFDNASGLPDPRNYSTARDLAVLARHLYLDFPQDYHYFATEAFNYHGRTFLNHDNLMKSYPGADGIKTGFIDASGFNLATSAVRNGHRLIGVVLGGQTAHLRDMKMASLLNSAFADRALPETPRIMTAQAKSAPVKVAATIRHAAPNLARRAARTLASLSPIAQADAATPSSDSRPGWSVQVGAYMQHAAALRAGQTARAKLIAERRKPIVVVATRTRRHAIYEARIVDLTRSQAHDACDVLHRAHRDCLEMQNSMQFASR